MMQEASKEEKHDCLFRHVILKIYINDAGSKQGGEA
jgi:hypothetical protein